MSDKPAKNRRRIIGVVRGASADKTVRVEVVRQIKHPLYEKIVRRRSHVQAHDPDNACKPGDLVTLEETPRVSKTKSWRVAARRAGEGSS